jgi:hypothetical protein
LETSIEWFEREFCGWERARSAMGVGGSLEISRLTFTCLLPITAKSKQSHTRKCDVKIGTSPEIKSSADFLLTQPARHFLMFELGAIFNSFLVRFSLFFSLGPRSLDDSLSVFSLTSN